MTKLHIGCSGFSNRDWKGFFYPETVANKDELTYYSSIYNCVEINSTFYRRPRMVTLEGWYHKTAGDFKFFVKIPKALTHIKRLNDTAEATSEFCEYIRSGLKEKLAGFLFQLPGTFKYSNENLLKVIKTMNPESVNVVEFRDKSWWTEEVFETTRKHSITFCGVSYPKDIPEDLVVNSSSLVYYRFHGKPILFKSEYSEEEMQNFSLKLKQLKIPAYIFFNNTWGTAGIKNSLALKKLTQ